MGVEIERVPAEVVAAAIAGKKGAGIRREVAFVFLVILWSPSY